jgi:hypothetical protein
MAATVPKTNMAILPFRGLETTSSLRPGPEVALDIEQDEGYDTEATVISDDIDVSDNSDTEDNGRNEATLVIGDIDEYAEADAPLKEYIKHHDSMDDSLAVQNWFRTRVFGIKDSVFDRLDFTLQGAFLVIGISSLSFCQDPVYHANIISLHSSWLGGGQPEILQLSKWWEEPGLS